MKEKKKEKVVIDVCFDEKQNQYYKVTDMWEGVPENCYGGSGIFINEFDLDEYAEDWEIVTDYRFI